MKRKLINLALLILFGAVWLYYSPLQPQEWGYLTAGFTTYVCLSLIPQRFAALIATTVVTVGMGVFYPHFLFCYAPTLFACAALFAAFSGKEEKPLYKDAVLLAALGGSVACTAISLWHSLIAEKDSAVMHVSLERFHMYAILFAAVTAFLCVDALRLYRKRRAAPKAPGSPLYIKLSAVYAVMLVSYAAVLVLYLKDVSTGKMSLLPVLLGAFAAVTEGMAVYTGKKEQGKQGSV
jgi:hypothetical protein